MQKHAGGLFGTFVQIAFWTVLLGFILSLSSAVLPWPDSLYRSALIVVCHALNFYFFYYCLIPRYFDKGEYLYLLVGFVLFLILLTPLRVGVENLFQIQTTGIRMMVGTKARFGFLIFSEVTIAAFASLLRLAVNNNQMKLRVTELEKSQLETELRFLKGQMSPHFLFNSINNIYSLVLVKSNQAPDALLKLSSLLRYLLYECDHKVSIEREIKALRTYSDLFQLKFKDPIKINWKIDVTDGTRLIEPQLLIPLFENAVKHSGLGIEEESVVDFSIRSTDRLLIVETSNTIFKSPAKDESGGIGLTNIRKRLENLFVKNHKLMVDKVNNRFALYLEMPLL
jgi:two-component system LytT family sensor kinase